MKQIIKGLSLIVVLSYFLLIAFLVMLVVPESYRRRVLLVRWLHYLAPDVLGILGIRHSVELHPALQRELASGRNHLILANHLSYIDVLVIASTVPTLFITSKEVESSFLGILAKAGGCIFVERRSRSGLQEENDLIAAYLKEGFNVVLFAEGTTSNGQRVLPFKTSLLESARVAGIGVLPVCLNYRMIDGMDVGTDSTDSIFYYGVMEFLPHLWNLLGLEEVWVEMVMLPAVPVFAYSSRRDLAQACHSIISNRFIPIPPGRTPGESFQLQA